jgi:integrase
VVIKAARSALKGLKQPSVKSQEDYARKADRLFEAASLSRHDQATAWMDVLTRYAPKSNSFFAMRAAAAWRAREILRAWLSRQCATQRIHGKSSAWLHEVEQTEGALETLNIIEDIERQELLDLSGQSSQPVSSKRQTLKHFPPDFRQRAVEHAQASEVYGPPVSVLEVTGCRPAELARGATVSLEFNHAVVRILGAKTTDVAGQAWREISVDYKALSPRLLTLAQDNGEVSVGVWSTAGLRSALRAIGKALWPRGPVLTPYHFRHALAEDLREAGWSAEEVGAALGHRVSETSAGYGRRRRPGQGRGGVTPVSIVRGGVRTAVAVRPLKPFILSAVAPGGSVASTSLGGKSAKAGK